MYARGTREVAVWAGATTSLWLLLLSMATCAFSSLSKPFELHRTTSGHRLTTATPTAAVTRFCIVSCGAWVQALLLSLQLLLWYFKALVCYYSGG